MKTVIAACVLAALAGCGVETATTAATSAVIKKQEMEEGKKTLEQSKQKLEESMQKMENARKEADQ